jgi:hypothetical protein
MRDIGRSAVENEEVSENNQSLDDMITVPPLQSKETGDANRTGILRRRRHDMCNTGIMGPAVEANLAFDVFNSLLEPYIIID